MLNKLEMGNAEKSNTQSRLDEIMLQDSSAKVCIIAYMCLSVCVCVCACACACERQELEIIYYTYMTVYCFYVILFAANGLVSLILIVRYS